MTSTLARSGLLLAALLAAGCAAQPGSAAAPASTSPSPSSSAAEDADPTDGDRLVLRVEQTGGFVPPQVTYSRLPLVSVYADGRVFTQGPVAAVYPGPALPNVLVAEVEPARVAELVQLALDAGVGEEVDYGIPNVADAPSTLFTVMTADGPRTTEVQALAFGSPEGDDGLDDRQTAARATLQDLVAALTAAGTGGERPYRPEAVAAVVREWVGSGELPAPEDVAWPGPPLPGEPLGEGLGLTCLPARGEAADVVLDAAATATEDTPWTDGEGNRWSIALRPFLPGERSCADLPGE